MRRRRPGKKARIQIRAKLSAALARKVESQKAAEEKDAAEREKRTRQRSATLSDEDDEGDVTVVSETNKRRRTMESMENAKVIDLSDD